MIKIMIFQAIRTIIGIVLIAKQVALKKLDLVNLISRFGILKIMDA